MSVDADDGFRAPGRRWARRLVLALTVVIAVMAAAVGSRPLWAATPTEQLIEALAWKDREGDTCGPPLHESLESLGELSTRSLARWADGTEHALADAVVLGHFTDIDPGRGFVVPKDGRNDLPVAFDDPSAPYRTVHARLEVESVLSGEVDDDAVLVGFHVRGSGSDWEHLPTVETAREGLPALGRVVVFLDRTSLWDFDHRPVTDVFLARVDEDGHLSLPLVPEDDAERLVGATPDLPSLEAALQDPSGAIVIDSCGHRID